MKRETQAYLEMNEMINFRLDAFIYSQCHNWEILSVLFYLLISIFQNSVLVLYLLP